MRPDGLVPSLLVFGCPLSFPIYNKTLPSQEKRVQILCSARKEMYSIVAEIYVKRALLKRLPPASRTLIEPSDFVRVYHKIEERWTGPCKVSRVDNKEIRVTDGIKKISTKPKSCRIRKRTRTTNFKTYSSPLTPFHLAPFQTSFSPKYYTPLIHTPN